VSALLSRRRVDLLKDEEIAKTVFRRLRSLSWVKEDVARYRVLEQMTSNNPGQFFSDWCWLHCAGLI
jgi:hypothetical protein